MTLIKINVSCYMIKFDFWPRLPSPPCWKWFPSTCISAKSKQ